jgi:hypothetical protein
MRFAGRLGNRIAHDALHLGHSPSVAETFCRWPRGRGAIRRLCVLTSGIGFDDPKTGHIDAAAEARNDRYEVGRVHVVVVVARLERLHKKGARRFELFEFTRHPEGRCSDHERRAAAKNVPAGLLNVAIDLRSGGEDHPHIDPFYKARTERRLRNRQLGCNTDRSGEAIGIRSSVPHDNPIARRKSEFKQLTSTVQERRAACCDDLLAKPRDIDVRLALTAAGSMTMTCIWQPRLSHRLCELVRTAFTS